mmetsp:Transcript_37207/g.86599  ORF Transcript_37207/g.86599 Transcript_37207/m.86599 type:complete len:378 (+) Transcript_37207:564-1697(+)
MALNKRFRPHRARVAVPPLGPLSRRGHELGIDAAIVGMPGTTGLVPDILERQGPWSDVDGDMPLGVVSPQRLSGKVRSTHRHGLQEQVQVPVHLLLHVVTVYVILVISKGVLNLHCNEVQRPKDEDLNEHEDEGPGRRRHPLREHEGRQDVVQQQQAITVLRVGEREWHIGDLDRVVEGHHAIGDLLERPGQDRRRDAEHACLNVLHHEELNPREDQFHPCFGGPHCLEALLVNACRVQQFVRERLDINLLPVVVQVLQIRKSRGMQHAKQPDQRVLEAHHHRLVSLGVRAERNECAASVKPLSAHGMCGSTAIPESAVCLGGAKDYEKPNEKGEPGPRLALPQDAVRFAGYLSQVAQVDQVPHQTRNSGTGQRGQS